MISNGERQDIDDSHFKDTEYSLTYAASCSTRLIVSFAFMSPLALAGSSWPSASGLCSVVASWFSKLVFSSFKFCRKTVEDVINDLH